MSFSLSQIKRKTSTKQDDIKSCHWLLKDMDILTDNVKIGLWKYADFRFRKRNRGKFNAEVFRPMIYELLEYCCGKPYTSVSLKDVEKFETVILYEIKKAIYYGATRKLYDATSGLYEIDLSKFKDTIEPPKPRNIVLEKSEVENYFGDVI